MSEVPEGKIYAQVDQFDAEQDYAPNRPCLRLVGVDAKSFEGSAFNVDDGCRTFLVDVAWGLVENIFELGPTRPHLPWSRRHHLFWREIYGHEFDHFWPDDAWVVVHYERSSETTEAYAYELFANAEPSYLKIISMEVVSGPPVKNEAQSKTPAAIAPEDFELFAFHVGQGMCSLIKGKTDGYLFDAGAGKPVVRSAYRNNVQYNGQPFVNELRLQTHGLRLQMILSHPDSDHWRLLDWDPALCNAISAIFKPTGTVVLAFKSPHVKPKVYDLGNANVQLTDNTPLFETHRSQPALTDRNGECLVVHAHIDRKHALLPGDYVYERMVSDTNRAISALATATFDAVMVPHHGDKASAKVTVKPTKNDRTVPAFFSAGTHGGYRHPRAASLNAHTTKMFDTIDKHSCEDIVARRLL